MLGLELVVALGVVILVANVAARRWPIPGPAILVLAGSLLALVPEFTGIGLPPEVVLLLFLPLLLYWEALTSSVREMRRFARGILLTGTLLVVVTAAAVAALAHALGVPWGLAWIIGAALAPTDATAVAALGRALPTSQLNILRSESLINDGTALVVYGLALRFASEGRMPSVGEVTGLFALSFLGGVAVGLVVGLVAHAVRVRLQNHVDVNLASFLTPFVAYLIAEQIHASGVLAVVTCGLFMSQVAPRAIAAAPRQQGTAFWTLTTTLLNAALFVLVGLQLPATVTDVPAGDLAHDLLIVTAVFVALPLIRFVFLIVSVTLIRLLDRRPYQRTLRLPIRARVVSAAAGLRGAISLAVALSVPDDLPGRNLVVFVVASVVVASLVIQGFAVPTLLRRLRMPEDSTEDDEYTRAQIAANEAALEALPALAEDVEAKEEVAREARHALIAHLAELRATRSGATHDPAVLRSEQTRDLRLAIVAHKRETVVRLRDERVIDDAVLRRIQAQLDAEEVRLAPPPAE